MLALLLGNPDENGNGFFRIEVEKQKKIKDKLK